MPDASTARYPGFELEPAGGRYRIRHIYRNGPADKEWIDLKVGDVVTAIDGTPLKAGDNSWRVLNHALNEYVTVTVAGPSGERNARIKTVPSLTDLKYEEWVEGNREFVDRESKGQIAYVHIRAMNRPSLQRFQNEITRFWNKRGIVVDIRFNGGTIRTPGSLVVTYDPTKPNNYGINLENYGVAPDVWVENTPEDELNGFDRELKTAVDEALRMLKERRWQFTTDADGMVPKG